LTITNWEKLKEEFYRAGYRRMVRRTFQLPDGKIADFDITHSGPAVCVLALTPENRVVLAQQYRPGPERIILELPGGGVEENETPLEAIRRELLEETGYTGEFQLVGTNIGSAYSTMIIHSFVAINSYKVQEPQNDEHEFIVAIEMELPEFRALLRTGELSDVDTGYRGLDFLNLL
jgi:ADP-ribose pyrophosphatase